MRISSFLKCFAIVCMATLASCSKDDGKNIPDVVQGAFEISGQKYNTLQDAVNAVMSSQNENAVITLTASTSGDGFTVKEGIINIDFGSNMYYLNPGKTIFFENSIVSMTGKGGELVGEGTIIKGSTTGLSFEGNLNVDGDMDVTEMDYLGFIEDYSGVYSGSVKLNESYLHVEADKAVLDIETLNTANSALNVVSAKSVTVDNVVKGSSQFPVCSSVEGVVTVNSGAEVHVHSYGAGVPGSCSSPEVMVKECPVCKDMLYYMDENNTKAAACDTEFLEHTEALAATDTEWGHAEHWECAVCGKSYADAQAQKLIDPTTIMIEPKGYVDVSDFEYIDDDPAAQTRVAINPKVIGQVVKGITEAADVINNISNFLNGEPSEEALAQEKIAEMDLKLTQILAELKQMQAQISQMGTMLKGAIAEGQLRDRLTSLQDLETAMSSFTVLAKAIKENGGLNNDEVKSVLEDWNKGNGTQRYLTTQQLASTYAPLDNVSGIDQLWQDVMRAKVLFEHEGYGPRLTSMIRDASVVQYSAVLAACYIAFVKSEEYSEDVALKDLKNLNEALVKGYEPSIAAARKSMQERKNAYIVYHKNGQAITFNRALGNINVNKAIRDHKDGAEACIFKHDVHLTGGCNTAQVSQWAGIAPEFDEEFVRTIMSYFSKKAQRALSPREAMAECGFTFDKSRNIAMYMTTEHVLKGSGFAICGNFDWRALRGSLTSDYLDFRGLLCWNASGAWIGGVLWGENTNGIEISSYDGHIKEFKKDGEGTNWQTATVVR